MRRLPDNLSWVLPYVRHPWANTKHLAVKDLKITLCGRVRPGSPYGIADPKIKYCERCLSRLDSLYPEEPE